MPTRPKVETSESVTVITFSAGAVGGVIARELEGHTTGTGARHLMLDFSNVAYLNSTEPGALIAPHKRVAASGGHLTLFNLSADVVRLFEITRLDTLLAICREAGGPSQPVG